MVSLKSIEIRNVRGVRCWELPLNGRGLVIYGENGSGKSSVVDALEFLFTGQVKHLARRRGLSLAEHCPNVSEDATGMRVTAVFDPGAESVSRVLDEEFAVPPTLVPLWSAASAGTFILRRSQLLEFIHVDPADRFRAIGAIIGLDILDEVELAFMRARDRLEADRVAQDRELGRSVLRLSSVGDGVTNVSDALAALSGVASDLKLDGVTSVAGIEKTSEQWLQSAKSSDQGRVSMLQALRASAEAAQLPHDIDSQLRSYQERHSAILSEREKLSRVNESAMLESAERVLADSESPVCPLCEQPIDLEGTRQRVVARLRVLQELSEEASDVRKRQGILFNALRPLLHRLGDLDRQSASAGYASNVVVEFRTLCEAAIGTIEQTADFSGECDLGPLRRSLMAYEQDRQGVKTYAETEQSKLALTDRDRDILSLVQRGRLVATIAEEIELGTQKLAVATEAAERASAVYSAFSSSKKDTVREVYGAIQAEIRRFYETLHPDDLHRDFELILAEGRRASTDMRITSFGSRNEDPRAFLSDGHLDSLGLCIFLAFAKGFLSGCRLLVLDDVVASIDASHRVRIAKLLVEEFDDRQVVITTHDGIWFEEIRKHQQAYGVEGRFLNLEIQRWTLSEGPVVRYHRPTWEALEAKLNEADKTGSANDGRQLLEWILKEMAVSLQAKVALKRDCRYVVNGLKDDVQARLRKLLPDKAAAIDSLFSEIVASATPGNLLSHSNADAQSMSIDEIRQFCVASKALVDWYACRSCQCLPVYLQQPKLIMCQSPSCAARKEWATH